MKIITTVGTSIFENCKNENPTNKDFKNAYKAIKEQGLPYLKIVNTDKDDIIDLQDGINGWFKKNNNASAEIASILAIAGTEIDVHVHLIATDTVLSVLAAELIEEWFKQNKPEITVAFTRPDKLEKQSDSDNIIQNLSITSNDKYQEGFMNLIEVVSGLIDKDKKDKQEVILNITGGYKAIIPIMTLIGQIKEVPLKYIYEESSFDEKNDGLVEVGNLPIHIDWKVLEPTLPFVKDVFPFKDKIKLIEECLKLNILNYKEEQNKISNGRNAASVIQGKASDEATIQLLEKIQVKTFSDLTNFCNENAKYWELMVLMKKYRLINDNLELTTIGKIIKEYKNQKPVGGTFLGHYIELFLFYYFSHQPKTPLIKDYLIQLPSAIKGFYGKDKDGNIDLEKTGTYGVGEDGNIDLNKNDFDIGDIDLTLKKNDNDVFGEIKAFGALTEIFDRIGTENDYYHQLKSRIVKYHNIQGNENKTLEFLFLIYEFQFVEFQEPLLSKIEQFETAKVVLQHISKLNDEFGDKCEFKIIGLQKLQPIHLAGAEKSLLEIKEEYHVWSEIKLI